MREHGGDIDSAIGIWGGDPADWLDLSTGINHVPWLLPEPLPAASWTALPTAPAMAALCDAARAAYRTTAAILPLAGAQGAIQLLPRLAAPGDARILAPTYNEYAASLTAAGWTVREAGELAGLAGADLAIVANPNNPDGRIAAPDALRALAGEVGLLVVDESFADMTPELSLAADAGAGNLLILRSFGKFYGLAGLRLGFVVAGEATIAALSRLAGPWPVSGPALAIGAEALADRNWQNRTIARLADDSRRMDRLATAAGWRLVGGTTLFRTYETPDAAAARDCLAGHRIWSRRFSYSARWLRLGLPGNEAEWTRVSCALRSVHV